uniref:Uncharacterized protein n=1 Tax=Anguilla anguilla TaxID=7936 RepID=A0A0E9Q7L5_ANGAN
MTTRFKNENEIQQGLGHRKADRV